jgi:hypothetical protein
MHRKVAGITGACTFILALGLAALAAAQAPANATGTWELTTMTSWVGPLFGGVSQTLTLKQDHAGKLTGTLEGRGHPQVTGSVNGTKIEFIVSFRGRNGHTTSEKYTGTISGDSMKGTVNGGAPWHAKRRK